MKVIFDEAGISGAEEFTKRSAILWSEELPNGVPMLIIYGRADDQVSFSQSEDLYEKLRQRKNVLFMLVKGATHVLNVTDSRIAEDVRCWFGSLAE